MNDGKALILLSGGLDSAVSLADAKKKYDEVLALTFDYRQKSAAKEIKSSKALADFYKINHKIIALDWLGKISNSALNTTGKIPELTEDELENKLIAENTSKTVWVPNRNALFINIAAAYAEAADFQYIITGANKEEGETFIDNSIDFINAVNNSLKYSVNADIQVKAPLINLTKQEIVKKGLELNLPFELIYSCYSGLSRHCGKCESCLRLKRAMKKCLEDDTIDKEKINDYIEKLF